MRMTITLIMFIGLAALMILGQHLYKKGRLTDADGGERDYHGYYYGDPADEITLMDHNGSPFTLSSLRGNAVLLFFGYTHCPDVCPTTLQTLKESIALLGTEERKRVRVLFVSVDPERDSPERLNPLMTVFGEEFIGLTGTPEEVQVSAVAYNITYRKEYVEGSEVGYLMGHTPSVFLIDPGGTLLLRYALGKQKAEWIASDLEKVLGQ